MNPERFARLCMEAATHGRTDGANGFGTLAEKRLHAVIKNYLCADEQYHEVGVEGTRFVSDLRIGDHVIEVQTGSFFPMKKKIAHYLHNTELTVTVVHPIAVTRWMSWVAPATTELSPRRKVRGETPWELLPELYYLAEHLGHPRLRFQLLLLEVQDFRVLNGWSKDRKKGSERYERMPLALMDEQSFREPSDFSVFLPQELPPHFTVKDFSAQSKLRGRKAYAAVRALAALGLIEAAEPIGRSMGWRKKQAHL